MYLKPSWNSLFWSNKNVKVYCWSGFDVAVFENSRSLILTMGLILMIALTIYY